LGANSADTMPGASVLALRVDKYAKAKKLLKPYLDLEA